MTIACIYKNVCLCSLLILAEANLERRQLQIQLPHSCHKELSKNFDAIVLKEKNTTAMAEITLNKKKGDEKSRGTRDSLIVSISLWYGRGDIVVTGYMCQQSDNRVGDDVLM